MVIIDNIEMDVISNRNFLEDLDRKFVYSIYIFKMIVKRAVEQAIIIYSVVYEKGFCFLFIKRSNPLLPNIL